MFIRVRGAYEHSYMMLQNIIKKWSKLNIYEKRCINDEHADIVFYCSEITEWNKIFTENLGPAIKPSGVKPTNDDLDLTKDCGGISFNQTLFKKEFDDGTVIAMFWPWQDGIHVTLKIIFQKKSREADNI